MSVFMFMPTAEINKYETKNASYCLLSPNLVRTMKTNLISASFKMSRTKTLKSKSPTDSRDFCPDPPSNEKLKSSLFWMN